LNRKYRRWHVCRVSAYCTSILLKLRSSFSWNYGSRSFPKYAISRYIDDVTPEILGSGFSVAQPESQPTRALTSRLNARPHTLHTSLHLQRNRSISLYAYTMHFCSGYALKHERVERGCWATEHRNKGHRKSEAFSEISSPGFGRKL
jgi:hypothetical protein